MVHPMTINNYLIPIQAGKIIIHPNRAFNTRIKKRFLIR
jgi:hypothetical protein